MSVHVMLLDMLWPYEKEHANYEVSSINGFLRLCRSGIDTDGFLLSVDEERPAGNSWLPALHSPTAGGRESPVRCWKDNEAWAM